MGELPDPDRNSTARAGGDKDPTTLTRTPAAEALPASASFAALSLPELRWRRGASRRRSCATCAAGADAASVVGNLAGAAGEAPACRAAGAAAKCTRGEGGKDDRHSLEVDEEEEGSVDSCAPAGFRLLQTMTNPCRRRGGDGPDWDPVIAPSESGIGSSAFVAGGVPPAPAQVVATEPWLLLRAPVGREKRAPNGIFQVLSSTEGGREASSHFLRLSYDPATDSSLVVGIPLSGRTHQLRLHAAFLNHPILNDPLYGSVEARQAEPPNHTKTTHPTEPPEEERSVNGPAEGGGARDQGKGGTELVSHNTGCAFS